VIPSQQNIGDEIVDVVGLLEEQAAHFADVVAVLDSETVLTYAELDGRTAQAAAALRDEVRAGDRVALWGQNTVEWVVLALALGRLGVTVVPLNTRYRRAELAHALQLTGARHLFADRAAFSNPLWEMAQEVCLRPDGTVDSEMFGQLESLRLIGDPLVAAASLDEGDDRPPRAADVAVVFFTSGSTGHPKAAAHSQRSLLQHAANVARRQGLTQRDSVLLAVPLCGSFGYLILMECLAAGATACLTSESMPQRLAEFLLRHRCSVLNITDAYLTPFLKAGETGCLRDARLSAGGVFEVEPLEFTRQLDAVGITFSHAYGMSEVHAMTFLSPADAAAEDRAAPGGPAVTPGTEVQVVNEETGQVLPPGARGIMQVRGPVAMLGYLSCRPDGTVDIADARDQHGWISTGDLASIDGRGHVEYLGRAKQALRLRGFLVAPSEIENFLMTHPEVDVCKVVGVRSVRGPDAVAFFESRSEPSDGLVAEVLGWCRHELANYKVPAAMFMLSEIPRIEGSTGKKIDIQQLEQMAARWLQEPTQATPPAAAYRD
jgi:fatty-acyl-CoA synthase